MSFKADILNFSLNTYIGITSPLWGFPSNLARKANEYFYLSYLYQQSTIVIFCLWHGAEVRDFSPYTISIYPTSTTEKNTLPHYSADKLEDIQTNFFMTLEKETITEW